MWIKVVILLAFAGILLSLGSALVFLIRDKGDSNRTLRALTMRIGLSIGLFVFIMVMVATGAITPHGVLPAATTQSSTGQ
jgi:formate/nitrite transporter FocA (FNT family)